MTRLVLLLALPLIVIAAALTALVPRIEALHGDVIAFRTSVSQLILLDTRYGTRLTLPGESVYDFTWMPDGDRLLVGQSDVRHISIIDADGGNRRLLLATLRLLLDPHPSPDGRYMLYSDLVGQGAILALTDIDTGATRLLLYSPVTNFRSGQWSPDGSRLLVLYGADFESYDLTVIDVETGHRLTLVDDRRVFHADWSPDGERITFSAGTLRQEVYLINADGTTLINISDHPLGDTAPAWSPDGETIAFFSNRAGLWDILLYSLTDGRLRSLGVRVGRPSPDREAMHWSPDGDLIAFMLERDLYTVAVDSGEVRRLTHDGPLSHTSADFAWRP